MVIKVDFIYDEDIEKKANKVLSDFGSYDGLKTPLDEITEFSFGLDYEVKDLGSPEVFGCIDIEGKKVSINSFLDPHDHPEMMGRYNYTLAHELGHWELHREYIIGPDLNTPNQSGVILCRTRDRKEPVEFQADRFASYLLMPKEKVYEGYVRFIISDRPIVLKELIERTRAKPGLMRELFPDQDYATDKQIVRRYFKPFADEMGVSIQALLYRLESLGLVT